MKDRRKAGRDVRRVSQSEDTRGFNCARWMTMNNSGQVVEARRKTPQSVLSARDARKCP